MRGEDKMGKVVLLLLFLIGTTVFFAGCEQSAPPERKDAPAAKSWLFSTNSGYVSVDKIEVEGKAFYVFRNYSSGSLYVAPVGEEKSR